MNTTITIKFADGTVTEHTVADTLEQQIVEGDMFCISTAHPATGIEIAQMYGGNPMSALGHMMMHRAALMRDRPANVDVILKGVNTCIEILASELSLVADKHEMH